MMWNVKQRTHVRLDLLFMSWHVSKRGDPVCTRLTACIGGYLLARHVEVERLLSWSLFRDGAAVSP